MTREEKQKAIDALKISAPIMAVTQEEFTGYIQTLNKIMDWLEQEPSGDLISRADAINALGYDISIESDGGLDKYKSVIKEMICKIYDVQKANIEKLPSVKQEPKEGHWIVHPKGVYAHLVCDKCLSNAPYDCRTNYCPNCGCRMVEQERSDKE